MVRSIRVGVTGGIGSGKSTVATMLGKFGAAVIDADAISREITASHGIAIPQIRASFGSEFIDATGALDRTKMRGMIFRDPSAKNRLEHILHPIIQHEMHRQADNATDKCVSGVVFDIPLLVESKSWRSFLDYVLVVDCTVETQIARVKVRNALTEAAVRDILEVQVGRLTRLGSADMVIFNDNCSLEQLANQVQAISTEIGL